MARRQSSTTRGSLARRRSSGFAPASGKWADADLAAADPTGDPSLFAYAYGRPITPKTVVTFEVEMPRAAALNNGAMYMFDPQFHYTSIYTCHPISEFEPEGLLD